MPPPDPDGALLPDSVLFVRPRVAWLKIPPPLVVVELSLRVAPVRTMVAAFAIPPPALAELLESVLFEMFTRPAVVKMPPPLPVEEEWADSVLPVMVKLP